MKKLLLTGAVLLCGCTAASVQRSVDGAFTLATADPQPIQRELSQSGSIFVGKFATISALNSARQFVSDYHGEVRFTLYPNEKIDCRFWIEGRDENGKPIDALATLCTGRLQRDNTLSFQGAYTSDALTEDDSDTFTIRGRYKGDSIIGDLVIGSVFRNDIIITDTDTFLDTTDGIRFEAVLLE
ncbi:MAG: hypothetical protein KC680_01685 [Candidatus Peregrinibacteria bacterium]|nr:hypothetical protein [Candidatus Peregrinibacteria bacterium]MCB9807648.1 hypothetical protein [Candidatus Peribacteria bacterium]